MDWVPVVFVTFKVLVLGTGMFFAIKWHYDQGKKEVDRAAEVRRVLRAGARAAAVFMLSLLGLGLFTLALIQQFDVNIG